MGLCQRKERQKNIRAEDIVDAAERVFFSKGIENSTMDHVAKEAEYSKRTIYAYFDSKEQLYNAIILRAFNILKGMFAEALMRNQEMNGLEKVMSMGRTFIDFLEKYPHYFKAISQFESWKVEFAEEDRIKSACHEEGGNSFISVINIVREGMQDGSIRDDVDAVSTAYILYANILGIGNIVMNKGKHVCPEYEKDTKDVYDEMIRFIERSLKRY